MKIVIVDDDRLVCASLRTIVEADPEIEVAAVGNSGREAVGLYARHRPDILLMDIRMEGLTGLEAGECILGTYPRAKILFLTTFSDDEYIVKALRMGAKGYLLKQNFESIVPSLKAVEAGQNVFGADVVARIPTLMTGGGKPDFASLGLTPRDAELLGCVAEGLGNREIAAKLCLSEGTVRNGVSVLLEKLGVHTRTQLAVFYYRSLRGEA
jgi:DNA-binding NarL/FixJ family response regulator